MRRKKHAHEKEPNLERWLVSYADFITLLFAVFVTLYAMSIVDKKKVEEVKSSIQNAFGYTQSSAPAMNIISSQDFAGIPEMPETPETTEAPEPPPAAATANYADAAEFARLRDAVQAHLAQYGVEKDVSLTISERGLVISLKESGFFDSGSAQMQTGTQPVLDRIAETLAGYANNIRVEGHTDTVPIHSQIFLSNWELSTARATNIVHYLLDRHNFHGDRLSATGYGEYRPVADNSAEAGRRLNRRVDIVLLSQSGAQGEPRDRHEQ